MRGLRSGLAVTMAIGDRADVELDDPRVVVVAVGRPPDHVPARADLSRA